uniref:DUF1073 domain-containing protein n=2 Tax=Macrostomum lignano TaxID=282301 RepID=A0A1I8HAF1_9PLAT
KILQQLAAITAAQCRCGHRRLLPPRSLAKFLYSRGCSSESPSQQQQQSGLPIIRLSPNPLIRSPGGLFRNIGNRIKLALLSTASRDRELTPRSFADACRDLLPVIVDGLAAADRGDDSLSGLLSPECLSMAKDYYSRMNDEQREQLARMASNIIVANIESLGGLPQHFSKLSGNFNGEGQPATGVMVVDARMTLLGSLKRPAADQLMMMVLQLMSSTPKDPDTLEHGFVWSLGLQRTFIFPPGSDSVRSPSGQEYSDNGWLVDNVNVMMLKDWVQLVQN